MSRKRRSLVCDVAEVRGHRTEREGSAQCLDPESKGRV